MALTCPTTSCRSRIATASQLLCEGGFGGEVTVIKRRGDGCRGRKPRLPAKGGRAFGTAIQLILQASHEFPSTVVKEVVL